MGLVRIAYARANREGVGMRFILLLIVVVAIFAVVQSKRHNCEFGKDGWLDCVIDKTTDEFST